MSDKVRTVPHKALQVCLDFQSVHVAAFRLRYKTPGGNWQVIATGTYDGQPCHDIAKLLPWDSVIDYRFLYTDEEDAPFKVAIHVMQDGDDAKCSPVAVTGKGGDFGIEGEIDLVEDCEG